MPGLFSRKTDPAETAVVDRLVEAVRLINDTVGPDRFLTCHQILPDERHFPDPVLPDGSGFDLVVARLLMYADATEIPFDVEFVEGESEGPVAGLSDERSWQVLGEPSAAFWFEADGDPEGGEWVVQISDLALDNADRLVASLALSTAWMFADEHDLLTGDRDADIVVRDVVAGVLGFGALLANSAVLHDGGLEDAFTSTFSRSTLGVLEPGDYPYLVALPLVVRGDKRAIKSVERALTANPRKVFKRAVDVLAQRTDLAHQLGLPPESDWPSPTPLKELTSPIELDEGD